MFRARTLSFLGCIHLMWIHILQFMFDFQWSFYSVTELGKGLRYECNKASYLPGIFMSYIPKSLHQTFFFNWRKEFGVWSSEFQWLTTWLLLVRDLLCCWYVIYSVAGTWAGTRFFIFVQVRWGEGSQCCFAVLAALCYSNSYRYKK